jgi:uracil-DNA glycosylase
MNYPGGSHSIRLPRYYNFMDKDVLQVQLEELLAQARACTHCKAYLPLGPRPVLRAHSAARMLIVGQAPGTRVHETGIPWNDPSGVRLRAWLGVTPEQFYDPARFAIIPMGFCYPGRTRGGDAPPRPECAPLWHGRLLAMLPNLELTLLIGAYSQRYYLGDGLHNTLTETVRHWREFGPRYLPLPHPSPRNNLWLRRNPWFEAEVVPTLRARVVELGLNVP